MSDPVKIVEEYLRRFGPATEADIAWWTGWSLRQTRAAIAGAATATVTLTGGRGLVLAGDDSPGPERPPVAALLPALDPTPMGWKHREWFLSISPAHLFDRAGNIGPTVWWDGRIVGGWAQRKDGEVVVRQLEDAGTDAAAAIEVEAQRLRAWLEDIRVTPRFRTPLERELVA